MAWTTPPTWAFGQLLTASDMNTYVRDNTNYLYAGRIPLGGIIAYSAISSPPTGFLFCNGTAVSRTTYSDLNTLFSAASYPYGAGDGTTTFNVPDLRGRVPAGMDTMGTGAASKIALATTLGYQTGSETVTLAKDQMPSHTHPLGDPGHAHYQSAHTHPEAPHTHSIHHIAGSDGQNWITSSIGGGAAGPPGWNFVGTASTTQITGAASGVVLSSLTNITIGSEGGGGSHSNLQPLIALTFCIKY